MSHSMLVGAVKAALIAFALSFVLLFVFAAVILSMPDPDSMLLLAVYAPLGIGSAVCGILSVLFSGEKHMLSGAISGVFYILLLLFGSVIAALFTGCMIDFLSLLIHSAVVMGLSLLISFAASKKNASPHSKKSVMRSAAKRAAYYNR